MKLIERLLTWLWAKKLIPITKVILAEAYARDGGVVSIVFCIRHSLLSDLNFRICETVLSENGFSNIKIQKESSLNGDWWHSEFKDRKVVLSMVSKAKVDGFDFVVFPHR